MVSKTIETVFMYPLEFRKKIDACQVMESLVLPYGLLQVFNNLLKISLHTRNG